MCNFIILKDLWINWLPWASPRKKLKRMLCSLKRERKEWSLISTNLLRKKISCTRSLSSLSCHAILVWCPGKWNSAKPASLILPILSSWALLANIAVRILSKPKITAKFPNKLFKSHSKLIQILTSNAIFSRVKQAKLQFHNWNLSLITVLWVDSIQQLKVCCKIFMSTWVEGTSFVMWMESFQAEWRFSSMIWCQWRTDKSLSPSH